MQLVVGAIGAGLGVATGIGPGLGFSIATSLFGLFNKPEKQVNAQQIMDLRIPGTADGQPIVWGRGRVRVAPVYAWHSDRRAITTTTTTEQDSGGPTVENHSTTYEMDLLYVLTIQPGAGVAEMYDGGELVLRIDSGASSGTIIASNSSDRWDRLTVYDGNPDQLPDPDYEAWVDANVGVGQAPAYRGRISVFIKGCKLGSSGQVRQHEFIVVIDGTSGPQITYFDQEMSSDAAGESAECASVYVHTTQEVWTIDAGHNGASAPKQLAIFNTTEQTTEFVAMPDGFVEASSTYTLRITHLVNQDIVLVSVRETGFGNPDILAFRVADRSYLGNWQATSGDQSQLLGIDQANERAFVLSNGTDYDIWTILDGLPGTMLANHTGVSGGRAFADSAGVFYTVIRNPTGQVWKHSIAGTSSFPCDADDAGSGPNDYDEFTFDEVRQRLYYWSLSQLKLKYVNCADDTIGTVGTFDGSAAIFYEPDSDRIYAIRGGTADPFYLRTIDPDDGDYDEYDIPDLAGAHFNAPTIVSGIVWGHSLDAEVDGASGLGELRINALAADCPTVADAQESLWVRGGLQESQINVVPLEAITREVCSLPWKEITPSREPTERMSGTYFYTVTMSGGKVKGIPRGEAVVATVPYDDLGANDGSGANGSRLPLRLVSDIETPAHEVINYINLSANLQQGSEKTDRLVSTSAVTLTPLEVSIGMTPDEAKGVIDTVLRDRASAVLAGRISLLRLDYPTLEPGDCITAVGINGSEYRLRIVQIVERFPLLDCDVVLDDPNVLSGQGITTTDYESQTTVSAPAQTMLRLLDIPILRNEDDYSGPYAFAKGTRTPYPGSAVFGSPDDIDYTRMSTINEAAIFGTCVTALGDWNGPRVVDFKNTVRVSVGAGVQLASSTRSAVLASQAVNAFAIGSDATGYELGQFIDAEEVSDGVYDLSNFLRGSRGTEWRMTGHASGERFYLLRFEGVRKLRLENAQLGASRYYKGVTLGRSIGSAMAQAFTTLGVAQKPFSPSQVRVSRDSSNNATITITRRTRLGVRYTGPLGFSVPLGEQTEAYSIDVYADDTYTTIVRTASLIGTNVIEYTASLQTADGLTPGDPLHMKAYQLSAIVGRGYALQRAA